MKGSRSRSVVLPKRRSLHRSAWKEIRGGDDDDDDEVPRYTLHEWDDADEYDDEYEYYEVEDTGDSGAVVSSSQRRKVVLPLGTMISSRLSALHQRLVTDNAVSLGKLSEFLSVPARLASSSGMAVAGTTTLSLLSLWILRSVILHKSGRASEGWLSWNGRTNVGGGRKKGNKDKKKQSNHNNKKKYGDYSTGYPTENGEEGDEVVDLDVKSLRDENAKGGSYWNAMTRTALVPWNTVACWMDCAKLYVASRVGKVVLFLSKSKKPLSPVETEITGTGNGDEDFKSMAEEEEDASPTISIKASTETHDEEVTTKTLLQQLDSLSEAHESLEQEYEASLRMLHEARMELRQLKSNRRSNDNNDPNQQQQFMESTIQTLEQKFKQQMKEQMERFRQQTEQKLRTELTQEYHAELQSQSEQMAQTLQQQNAEYQKLVDEASSAKIQEAVAQAVREQQLQSREEMKRVREAIQKVLERERRMMKEQVVEATSRVREWVKRQQVEQWQRREEQLVVEARELGLLEEEENEEVGDGLDPSRRDRDGSYVGGSSIRRDGSMGGDEEEETPRGDDYPDRSEDYYEYKEENGEDDGAAGEVGRDLPDLRVNLPRRQPRSSSSNPRNVYREAAKRKQRRREEGL